MKENQDERDNKIEITNMRSLNTRSMGGSGARVFRTISLTWWHKQKVGGDSVEKEGRANGVILTLLVIT